jgi:hypothetical protein
MLEFEDVVAAQGRVAAVARHTPLDHSHVFSKLIGADVHLKLETFQRTGSFKIRGAANRLATLFAGFKFHLFNTAQGLFIGSAPDSANYCWIINQSLLIYDKLHNHATFDTRLTGLLRILYALLECLQAAFEFGHLFYDYEKFIFWILLLLNILRRFQI